MVSGGHIGFRKYTNNIRNEFPIPKLCKIDPLHTFPCSLVQKLMIAQNPIWRPAAILDLWHFLGSDWWGFLGCGYWGTKGMKSAEKPFCAIFFHLELYFDWATTEILLSNLGSITIYNIQEICTVSLVYSSISTDLCISWWRNQMETFSALLALCVGNSPVTGEFPAQRPVTRNLDVFLDLHLNKQLSK